MYNILCIRARWGGYAYLRVAVYFQFQAIAQQIQRSHPKGGLKIHKTFDFNTISSQT